MLPPRIEFIREKAKRGRVGGGKSRCGKTDMHLFEFPMADIDIGVALRCGSLGKALAGLNRLESRRDPVNQYLMVDLTGRGN